MAQQPIYQFPGFIWLATTLCMVPPSTTQITGLWLVLQSDGNWIHRCRNEYHFGGGGVTSIVTGLKSRPDLTYLLVNYVQEWNASNVGDFLSFSWVWGVSPVRNHPPGLKWPLSLSTWSCNSWKGVKLFSGLCTKHSCFGAVVCFHCATCANADAFWHVS